MTIKGRFVMFLLGRELFGGKNSVRKGECM